MPLDKVDAGKRKRSRLNQVHPVTPPLEFKTTAKEGIVSPDLDHLVVIDADRSLENSDANPYHILFVQDSMIENRDAYSSWFVNSFRFYFLFKTSLFQVLLVTLPYSPRI